MLLFPDASKHFLGCCVTEVSAEEYGGAMRVEQMQPEPLGFASGAFRESQLHCPTVDKEGSRLWQRSRCWSIYYRGVFISPGIIGTWPTSLVRRLAVEQCSRTFLWLAHWRKFLGQYRFAIVHIPGIDNKRGDLLSRWRMRQPAIQPARQGLGNAGGKAWKGGRTTVGYVLPSGEESWHLNGSCSRSL